MGGPCTCDGKVHAEMDNFHRCNVEVDFEKWPSAEHCYQAAKFPGNDELREKIRRAPEGMEAYQLGNTRGATIRADWEEVKVDEMYKANKAKFGKNDHLKHVLTSTHGPIVAQGGLFWKTWNEILLERLREELREPGQRRKLDLALRISLMSNYKGAVLSGDRRKIEAATVWAAQRKLPPAGQVTAIKIIGFDSKEHPWAPELFHQDVLRPLVNEQPHYMNNSGYHLYLGSKRGRHAWVIDEELCATEVGGFAFFALEPGQSDELPRRSQTWQVYSETTSRHAGCVLKLLAEGQEREDDEDVDEQQEEKDEREEEREEEQPGLVKDLSGAIRLFETFDSTGSGRIPLEDMRLVMVRLGVKESDLEKIFNEAARAEAGTGEGGTIDYRKLLSWLAAAPC